MLKPHAAGITAFDGGELKKSFSAMSLNKSRTLSGGGSGYRSEAKAKVTEANKYKIVGKIIAPSLVLKTIIHAGGKRLSKPGYVKEAYKLPYVYKVEYISESGKMVITNTNIK